MSPPRRPGGAWVLWGLLIALAAVAAPSALQAQSVDREVVGLEFRGNDTFDDEQLSQAVATTVTRCQSVVLAPFCLLTDWGFAHERAYLDEAALPADLLRLRIFYKRRGFRDVAVDTAVERTDGEALVTFRIEEGAPTLVGDLHLEGLDELEDGVDVGQVRRALPLREGDRLDLVALERGKSQIVDWLENRGYPEATVLDEYFIPTGERRARVTLDVRPGRRMRIGEITVRGAGDVGEDVVRKVLTFRSGEWYRRSEVLESQRSLYRLEAIRFANIETRPAAAADTLVGVVVDVTPADERTVRAGVGATTVDCARTEVQFVHRNFPAGARRLRLTGELSNLFARQIGGSFPCTSVGEDTVFQELNFSLQADYQIPFFLSARNRLEAALFLERETVPDIFVRTSRGGEISLTRQLRPRMPLTLSWRPELTGFDESSADVFFCVNFGFCQPEDIAVLTESRWLSPLGLSWQYDRTNAPFSPTSGYYVNLSMEGAETFTGSDYQYLRFDVNAADFEELAAGLVLATRFRAGFVEATGGQPFRDLGTQGTVIHPRKRFFAGGAQSVRGVDQNLLGPTVLVMSAADCAEREEGFSPTRGQLVQCARDVAGSDRDPDDFFQERPIGGDAAFEANFELRTRLSGDWTAVGFVDVGQVWVDVDELEPPVVTPGVGIRYASPVGPIRVDVGYDPSGVERLPVVAELRDGEILELEESVAFDPFSYDDAGSLTEFRRRLNLHISIGEAF